MSWANNGPAGPPQGQPYGPPQTPPPQGPQQPRWAWWVIGIVIPVVGILITILVARPGSSGDDGDRPAESAPTASARSGGGEGQGGGQEPSSAPPTADGQQYRKVFGPDKVDAEASITGSYIELDTPKPLVMSAGTDGADIIFGSETGDPSLFVPDSATTLAQWADPGTAPTPEECVESVGRNSGYSANVKPGETYCLQTGESRIAYLKVVTAPDSGGGQLDVTVWERSDA
ncbi:hypothetical protein [Streptomyces sp. AC550_RSS872]|uniref:hypothetical protein n=1 Tax=Streptomyces sp. AC550_RSS872 TaxID=2823689 RepID=UPI001C25F868|nr:hypothetical protein [Streptomyces sp. AC550_RSS872]